MDSKILTPPVIIRAWFKLTQTVRHPAPSQLCSRSSVTCTCLHDVQWLQSDAYSHTYQESWIDCGGKFWSAGSNGYRYYRAPRLTIVVSIADLNSRQTAVVLRLGSVQAYVLLLLVGTIFVGHKSSASPSFRPTRSRTPRRAPYRWFRAYLACAQWRATLATVTSS